MGAKADLDYRFLNMDTEEFHDNQESLNESIGYPRMYRAIPNWQYGQVLVAGGVKTFSEFEAEWACRKLSKEEVKE